MTGLEYFQDFVTNNILKINVLSNATAAMFLYIWPEQKNWLPAKSHTKGHLPLSIGPHKSSETTSWWNFERNTQKASASGNVGRLEEYPLI